MMDARNDGKSIWTLSAHSEGVNGLSLSSQCPGLLVTGKNIYPKYYKHRPYTVAHTIDCVCSKTKVF
jgi:hypothetical protein